MATLDQLRNNIIDKLMTISNKGYLEALNKLVDKSTVQNRIFTLNEAQIEMLMMSEEDIKSGRLISQKQSDDEDLLWLNQQ